MSAAPQMHYSRDTDSLARAYNSAAVEQRPVEAAGMTETWKQWQGRAIRGSLPLQRYLGGSDHSAVFLSQRGSEKVAIKLVAADPANAEAQLSRWRLAAKLSDPRLLHIFEAGRDRLDNTEILYVVMEYAEEDLSQILPQRSLTADEVRAMMKPILGALAYIHGQGCVHGRIRPSNVHATGDQIKLSSDSLTASGETTRSEPSMYDAPESADHALSPPSDVWSVGVLICEALTQRLPDTVPSGPAVLPAGVPEPFAEIARRSLHGDPRQRWKIAQISTRLEPVSATSLKADSNLATPVARAAEPLPTPVPARQSFRLLYLIPLVVAGLAAWFLMSGSKTTKAPTSSTPPTQTEQQAQPANSPQPTPATPEEKPSPVTPAKARKGAKSGASSTSEVASNTAPNAESGSTAVKTGSASSVPGVVHTVMPAVAPSARRTITGKVRVGVRVDVDTSGNVTKAVLDSSGPSQYFARLAVEAARQWKFTPAQANGQFVASQWILHFGYTRRDTEVVPKRIAP